MTPTNIFTLEKMKIDERLRSVENSSTTNSFILKEIHEMVKKQNGRVGKLEKWQSFVIGGTVVITGLVTYGLAVLKIIG